MLALLVDAVSVLGRLEGQTIIFALFRLGREAQSPAGAICLSDPDAAAVVFRPWEYNHRPAIQREGRMPVDEQRSLQEVY